MFCATLLTEHKCTCNTEHQYIQIVRSLLQDSHAYVLLWFPNQIFLWMSFFITGKKEVQIINHNYTYTSFFLLHVLAFVEIYYKKIKLHKEDNNKTTS
jgi:predicted ABC-type exoprotein transport system permease subunit